MTIRKEETPLPEVGRTRREIGRAGGHTAGPTVICVAALHGNEPAGVLALRRVFQKIEESMIAVRGELVGLAGNLPAIAVGKRYLDHDLNRRWTPERAEALRQGPLSDEDVEDGEHRELLEHLLRPVERGDVVLLDLHTASAPTVPFVIIGDTLRNREFARSLPTPIVLGVEERLFGTMAEYATGLGHVSIAFEAGQHDDPASVDFHEAAVWLMLVRSGVVDGASVAGFESFAEMLREARSGLPGVMEIVHRHEVSPEDGFVMRPGFRNFQRVSRGEHLGDDHAGQIRSPASDRVFLPLYQGLGEDGFFLARPVNPVWLTISSWLRGIGVPAVAVWLPGVRRHAERRDRLVVDRRVARLFPRELFHLLGYRVRTEEERLVVKKREDVPG